MEDKELQELFAAKRTVEANRRRQEELRHLLETSATPKSRRLWPVWAGAAAAAILLLLLVTPLMPVGTRHVVSEVAQTETIPALPIDEPLPIADTARRVPTEAKRPVGIRHAVSATEQIAQVNPLEENPPEVLTLPVESEPIDTFSALPSPPSTPHPTIHRRTSSRMVCSNCSIHNDPSHSTAFQDFLTATFGAEVHPPLTLTNIEF